MYQLTKLENGLRVLSTKLGNRNSVALGIWVRAGGRFEAKRVSGISHFLEHMLFKGTTHRSTRKIKADIEGVGGMLNAFTGEESTCYFVKILENHFEKAFDVLSDMVNHALLDEREHEKERTVILEEIKMYLDLPSHYVHEIMGELLWPGQALGRSISGTAESVNNLRAKDLRIYREKYYHPKNLLVSCCGGVPHDTVCQLTKQAFEKQHPREFLKFDAALSRQTRPRFHLINKKTEQMHFVIGFHGLSKIHPERYQLAVLNVLLGANMSSRLFEEVREKRGLAYEIRSGLNFFEDTGAVVISAGTEPKKSRLAVQIIMRELKRLKETLVNKDELQRAKDYFLGQFLMGLEDTLEHMLWIGERMLYRDEMPNLEETKRRVEQVTSDDIRELARKIFRTQGLNLSLIGSYENSFEKKIKEACDCD